MLVEKILLMITLISNTSSAASDSITPRISFDDYEKTCNDKWNQLKEMNQQIETDRNQPMKNFGIAHALGFKDLQGDVLVAFTPVASGGYPFFNDTIQEGYCKLFHKWSHKYRNIWVVLTPGTNIVDRLEKSTMNRYEKGRHAGEKREFDLMMVSYHGSEEGKFLKDVKDLKNLAFFIATRVKGNGTVIMDSCHGSRYAQKLQEFLVVKARAQNDYDSDKIHVRKNTAKEKISVIGSELRIAYVPLPLRDITFEHPINFRPEMEGENQNTWYKWLIPKLNIDLDRKTWETSDEYGIDFRYIKSGRDRNHGIVKHTLGAFEFKEPIPIRY